MKPQSLAAPSLAAPSLAAQSLALPARSQTSQATTNPLPTDQNGKPILFNDPPASPDTLLCGLQAREANAIGASLPSARLASIAACASFTCYDPLTATYIGADSYRHVCR